MKSHEENDWAESPTLAGGVVKHLMQFNDIQKNMRINTDWWRVFDSFRLPDFDSSPIWIASQLNLSVEQVVEALTGLEACGYIRKTENGYLRSKDFIEVDYDSLPAEEKIESHAICAQQILNHLSPKARAVFRNACLAAPKSAILELFEKLADDISLVDQRTRESGLPCDGIYLLSFIAIKANIGREEVSQ